MITPIYKNNTPLMHFSFLTDKKTVVPLSSNIANIVVMIHDSVSIRPGAGALSNLNANAGTVDYLASAADTANVGLATWWATALLPGETQPRTFDPQKILIVDPSAV